MTGILAFEYPVTFRIASSISFFFNDTASTEIYTLSLHDALPIYACGWPRCRSGTACLPCLSLGWWISGTRSEEHTSELQSRRDLVCRLLLEKKKHHNNHLQVYFISEFWNV